jgi:hypothetical protein
MLLESTAMNRTITGIVSGLVFGREGLQLIAVAQGRISRIPAFAQRR